MAGILILLTISSIKDGARLSLYGLICLTPFALSAVLIIIGGMYQTAVPWYISMSRVAAIAGFMILVAIIASVREITRTERDIE